MKEKKKLSINTKLILFLVISTLIMSVGYAILTGTSLSISGGASIANDGVVSITSVTNHASSNVTENTAAAIVNDGQGISFDLNVTVTQNNYNQDFYITYRITVNNDSISNQKVLATNFTPVFTGSGVPPTATFDITDGNGNSMLNDTIPAKTTNTYYLTITMHPTETGSWGVGGETTVETGDTDTGTVIGSLSGTTQGDLTGNNNLVHFTVDVINSHDTSKTFTLSITDAKFEIVNQNGNALSSMTINANSTSTYDFYIKKASGAKFMVSQQDLNIYLNCDGNTQSTGVVNLTVDVDPTLTDFNAPVISNVTATQLSTDKQVRISWNYSEENTVTNFFIEIYVVDEMTGRPDLRDTVTVPGSQTSSIVTLQFGSSNYLFKVYGIDQSTNTASSDEISTCNTNAGHCSRNNSRRYSWSIIVDLTLNYATANSGSITTLTSRLGRDEEDISEAVDKARQALTTVGQNT